MVIVFALLGYLQGFIDFFIEHIKCWFVAVIVTAKYNNAIILQGNKPMAEVYFICPISFNNKKIRPQIAGY